MSCFLYASGDHVSGEVEYVMGDSAIGDVLYVRLIYDRLIYVGLIYDRLIYAKGEVGVVKLRCMAWETI